MKHVFLFLIFVFSSAALSAQTSEEFFKMAYQKFENEQYLDANTLIDKAIEKDKHQLNNYILKSEIEFKLRNVKGVLQNMYTAIAVAPKNSEPYSRAGEYYSSFGYPDSAIAMYNRAIERAENDTILYAMYVNRASAYMSNQQFKLAKTDLERTLKFNPNSKAALNNMAVTLDGLKETKEALVYLDKLARLDSTFVGTFINLGLYHTELGNYKSAKTNFDYALTLKPDEPLLYSNRGFLYYKIGDYTAAIKDLNRSIDSYPTNPYAYRNRALVYIAMQKQSEACRDLEAALHYGFTQFYGDEVKKLSKKNCK